MSCATKFFDEDLNPVLNKATRQELEPLVEYQKNKFSELLTISDEYKKYAPDHSKYSDLIAKELRDFGGNTFANKFRGEGPSYYIVVCQVADQLKAPYNKSQNVEKIEDSILATILEKAWQKMTEEERKELMKEMEISNTSAMKGIAVGTFQAIFQVGGFKSYQLTLIIANQVARIIMGKGFTLSVNAAIAKWASILSGPVGWAISSIWTLIDLAGPSYKVTIPSVIHVAYLRKIQNSIFCSNCNEYLNNKTGNFCPKCGGKLKAA